MSDRSELAEPNDEMQDDYALDNRFVASVLEAVDAGDRPRLVELFEPLHPADIADLLEQIDEARRQNVVALAGD